MKVLVLSGPESSGKSWLAQAISTRFGAQVVDEYVRGFIDRVQRETCYADVETIARGQLAEEDAGRAQAPRLLVLDTHLLSNRLWSETLFGEWPAWIDEALLARHYDLHLLLSPEGVEWVGDGQRCQPGLDERQVFFRRSIDWLDAHGQVYQVIQGDWAARQVQAFTAVQALLQAD
jgi:NadR type nicotinamide-nucleotide adenylyltransferase